MVSSHSMESSESQPRVISINLSGKNLTGNIPPELAGLSCLAEIRLDKNMLIGSIPDLSGSSNLSIFHFENNQLTGSVPSYLSSLPKLSELYTCCQQWGYYWVVTSDCQLVKQSTFILAAPSVLCDQ